MLQRAIALMLVVLALGLTSCGGDRDVPVVLLADDATATKANRLVGAIAEVSPPERIQQLKPYLDVYAPQVRIATPDPDATLTSTTVQVEVQVRDFPIYKDQSLGFGPHLHLFIDDQPHQAIYDAGEPISLENLAPGTHTLRLLAVRPWGESFKNEGAYDQVTFNVFAPSPQNNPDDSQPVLTYNQPQDRYGAEPILLDFHLNNAPPHLVAQADETITDWRIRCTINGESFVFDRWQPIYLQGFQPGKNWLKLELIDENGNLIDNALNTTVRVIDYQPGGDDSLSQLVRGEIPLAQAKVLIDPSYEPPAPVVDESAEQQHDSATTTGAATTSDQPESLPADSEDDNSEELDDTEATPAPNSTMEASPAKSESATTPAPGSTEKVEPATSDDTETVIPQPTSLDVEAKPSESDRLAPPDTKRLEVDDASTAEGNTDVSDAETKSADQLDQPPAASKTAPATDNGSPAVVEDTETVLPQEAEAPQESTRTLQDQIAPEDAPSMVRDKESDRDEPGALTTEQLPSTQDAESPAAETPTSMPASPEAEDLPLLETAPSTAPSDAETADDVTAPNTDLNTLEDNADLI